MSRDKANRAIQLTEVGRSGVIARKVLRMKGHEYKPPSNHAITLDEIKENVAGLIKLTCQQAVSMLGFSVSSGRFKLIQAWL